MKKLYFVIESETDLEELILCDALTTMIGTSNKKAVIFHPSMRLESWQLRELWKTRNIAVEFGRAADVPVMSLGSNISDECFRKGQYSLFWKFLNECTGGYGGFETYVIVLPKILAHAIQQGSYVFTGYHINGPLFASYASGEISCIDVSDSRKKEYYPESFIDERFSYINSLPKALLPDGYSSPSKGGVDTRNELQRIQLEYLGSCVDKNIMRGAIRRSSLLKSLAKLTLHYKEAVQAVA